MKKLSTLVLIVVTIVAIFVTKNSFAAGCATMELIGMHKILENHQKPLTFFPMFLEDL